MNPLFMKLRDHPSIKPHWPPQWTPFFGRRVSAKGEIGTLEDVRPAYLNGRCCFLVVEHNSTSYLGELTFEDEALCHWFMDLLRPHRGKSIAQIAELDIR